MPSPIAPVPVLQAGSAARSLKEDIRAAARRLGFALCGFARADVAPHAAFVREWIAAGNAGGMGYLERGLTQRLDPRHAIPAVRSVITVGYRYLPPPLPPIDWQRELRGRIAAYSLGADYHRIVAERLRALAAQIATRRPGALLRPAVDTSAVLEREWAALGGVGWFGRNTNILHNEDGSYFFLGELLTDIELDPDRPIVDHCGTCTRCLDLCPTTALRPGYVLDARLCISYLTIEHRGAIPRELRDKLGNWIFGCDVCQEVCPWNEKLVRERSAPALADLLPYLPDLARLSEAQFRNRFRRSAIRRATRAGLVRNVMVALGNTRNPAAVTVLGTALLDDASPLVRQHAAWALGRISDQRARRALDAAWRREADAGTRREIETAFGESDQ
jgi:epoxyqueuosine reductase